MDSGFYTSAVGMLDGFNVENNISDNLANMQTPGYKERTPVLEDFSRALYNSQQQLGVTLAGAEPVGLQATPIGRFGLAPTITSYGLNLAQGNPRYTGNPLDTMIVGNAFFSVRAGNGTLLTRNGSFHRSAAGVLETAEGYQVLGANGQPVKLPAGEFEINQNGEVLAQGKRVGRLALQSVQAGQPLNQVGAGYYRGPGRPVAPGTAQVGVLQGYLETSNVDMASQMSNMMAAQRAYQAGSRMLQMQDDTMSLTVNDLGKVGS